MIERFKLWCLAVLIIFLPLSAWLVSFGGSDLIGLGRDVLLGGYLATSALAWRSRRPFDAPTWLAIVFGLLVLASFWHRQDSIAQWLRGARYLAEPFVLFMALRIWPLRANSRLLWRSLAVATVITVVAALLELLDPSLLRLTLNEAGRGYLGQINFAGSLPRLQSTLAGPNALGLFLMIVFLLWPLWQKTVSRTLAVGVGVLGLAAFLLTFSRSSYLGFLVGVVVLTLFNRKVSQVRIKPLLAGLTIVLVLLGGVFVLRPPELFRSGSDSRRIIEYQRIWEQRSEIGWWGRGAGASGLVSQYRLDTGPNYFTENTYLDIYEAVGLPAALIYLAFWLVLIRALFVSKTVESATIGVAVLGLVVAGFFINQYTGQAAIWLTLLFAGVVLGQKSKDVEDFFKPTTGRAV